MTGKRAAALMLLGLAGVWVGGKLGESSPVKVDGFRVVVVERVPRCLMVARSQAALGQGLMRIQHPLPMVFELHDRAAFWMKDTPSPLRLVWVRGFRVVGEVDMAPYTQNFHVSPGRVDYAIEYPPRSGAPRVGAPVVVGNFCGGQQA
jgi:uncharacterized membrane protein (UPF0127 family)